MTTDEPLSTGDTQTVASTNQIYNDVASKTFCEKPSATARPIFNAPLCRLAQLLHSSRDLGKVARFSPLPLRQNVFDHVSFFDSGETEV